MTWPTFFAGGFDDFIRRSHRDRVSIVLRFETIFHLDDLTLEEAELLRPHSFLIVETSPGSLQAWVQVPTSQNTAEGRRAFRARLKELGVKAGNHGSTHSGRWPGSINAKPARNGWEVSIWWLSPGRRSSLEAIGATMPAKVPVKAQRSTTGDSGATKGTSRAAYEHEKNKQGRPKKPEIISGFSWDRQSQWDSALQSKGEDRSKAHASYYWKARAAGFSDSEIVDDLWALSDKWKARDKYEEDVERIGKLPYAGGVR